MKKSSSQILIEVLIALTATAVLVISISELVAVSLFSQERSRKETVASFLASEAQEATKAIKASSWSSISLGTYHPDKSTGVWTLLLGEETVNIEGINFTRKIEISEAQRDFQGKIVETGGLNDPSTRKLLTTVTWEGKDLTLLTYITRYVNQVWQQTTASDFNAGIKNNVMVTNLSGGEIQLAQGGISFVDFGNKFLVTTTSSIGNMTSSAFKNSMRFSTKNSKTVTSLWVYFNRATNRVTYRYGIQEDVGGLPSGNYLGYGDLRNGTVGWNNVVLNTPINLTTSSIYHLVVEYQSGTISHRNYIALRNTQPDNNLYPFDSSVDLQADTLWFDGANWTTQNRQPLYILSFNDATFEGNSYENFAERAIYGTNVFGEVFLAKDEKVKDISFYIAKNANKNPADSLYFSLINRTTNTPVVDKAILASGSDLTTNYTWKTYTFSSEITLAANQQYLISLESPNSNSKQYYKIYSSSTSFTSKSLTYQGEAAQEFMSGSLNPSSDLAGFKFTQIVVGGGYATSGTFLSSTFNGGNPVGFNRFSWTSDIPTGTALRFQTASNNDNATWNFIGPDGTAGTFYESPQGLYPGLSNNQYFKYKVYLETTDQTKTPTVYEVNINWSP